MDYDPGARRDTPLALKLKARIRAEGPISVRQYMQACLHDPEHGYYRTQAAIGAGGDFVTAPEISQVFGELIGLWCAVVWQQMGKPARLNLIELGPGRGTLMADALRATRLVPDFRAALSVHLAESNVALRDAQRVMLLSEGSSPLTWHDDAVETLMGARCVADGPGILIGNEFLDTLPTEQWVLVDGRWHGRGVGLDAAGRLQFIDLAADRDFLHPAGVTAKDGDIWQICTHHIDWGRAILGSLARSSPMAALFIDYGHARSAAGDTLQAVWQHEAVSPLFAPGETDLTTAVDFESFANQCRASKAGGAGLAVDGPITQAEFLGRLGIVERASKLMAANPGKVGEIEMGVARLIAPAGMGGQFKAIGVRSAGLPVLPGFEGASA